MLMMNKRLSVLVSMKIIQIRVVLRWSVCQLICNSAGDRILTSLPKILVLMFYSPHSKNHYYVFNMLLLCTTHRAHNFGNHFLLCECLEIEYLLTSCPCAAILIYKARLCVRPSVTLWPKKFYFFYHFSVLSYLKCVIFAL